MQVPGCTAQAPSWQQTLERVRQLSDAIFDRLEDTRSLLTSRAGNDHVLLARLSAAPAIPRASGYGLLPEIRADAPIAPVTPRQTVYSLRWLADRLQAELENTEALQADLPRQDLDSLVRRYEDLRNALRDLEDHLSYHAQWQKAVGEHPAYFRKNNKLLAKLREIEALEDVEGTEAHRVRLRTEVERDLAAFRPTPGLAMRRPEGGGKLLPVTVCTDIRDRGFLAAFTQGVDEAFSQSPAARAERFTVELSWRIIPAETLYPGGAPRRGDPVDPDSHLASFSDCPLILTTGGASTHASMGEYIVLGTEPETRRTLAHEFGHLIGFGDTYLRGYDGDPDDPYGVVLIEWTGLVDSLMGNPTGGPVDVGMIRRLLAAY